MKSRTRAKRLPAEERRRQILDAAIKVFARSGYRGAGTADIAAEAGIGEPTIYRYFADKHDLYLAAVRSTCADIKKNWGRIASSNDDPTVARRLIGVWYYDELTQRPELLLVRARSLAEASDPEVLEGVRQGYLELVSFVRDLYERAKARGQLQPDADTNALAWMFMATGALLDLTYLMGLRHEVGPTELASMMEVGQKGVGTERGGS